MTDVEYTEHGHVGLITLNRPGVHNALRRGTCDELTGLVRDATARALVITGAGPSFCSGDDVRELMGGGMELALMATAAHRAGTGRVGEHHAGRAVHHRRPSRGRAVVPGTEGTTVCRTMSGHRRVSTASG
jgi:enoyl-CoA hydratase/carnithine racemase